MTRRTTQILLGLFLVGWGLFLGGELLLNPEFLPYTPPPVRIEDLTVEEFLKLSSTDLNSANQKELIELPGIGEVLAQRIIDYRRVKAFQTVEELCEVEGIGEWRLAQLQGYVYVD